MAHISTPHPMSLIVLVAWLLLFDISSFVQPATITVLLPVSEIQPLLSSATREIATSRATLAATVANLGEIAASLESNSKKVEEQNELNISETKDKIDQGLASLSVQGASDKDQVEAVKSDDQSPSSPKINSEGRIKRAVHAVRNVLRKSKARRVSLGRKLLRRPLAFAASGALIGLSLGNIVDRILKRLTPEYVQLADLTEPAEDVYNNPALKYATVQEQFGSTPPFGYSNPWFKYSTGQFGQFGSTPQFVYNRQVRQSELDTSVVGYYTKIVVIGAVAVAILVSIVAGLAYYLLVGRKPKTSSSKNLDSGSSKSATSSTSSSALTEKGAKTLGSKNP